jgi:hypothetical protein
MLGLGNGRGLAWWCPGCEELHVVSLDGPLRPGETNCGPWAWNGDGEAPTFTPSVNVRSAGRDPDKPESKGRCHVYVTAGVINFLGDCQHALVGQSVAMPPLPPWHLDSDDPIYREWLRTTHPDVWQACFGAPSA